jgi:hypothetical protein
MQLYLDGTDRSPLCCVPDHNLRNAEPASGMRFRGTWEEIARFWYKPGAEVPGSESVKKHIPADHRWGEAAILASKLVRHDHVRAHFLASAHWTQR